jgi:hypothetical protein
MMISFKNYALYYINDDRFLSFAGAIGLLLNGFMRLIWPLIIEKCSFKCANIIIGVV